MSAPFEDAKSRVALCSRLLLSDAQTLRQMATTVNETAGYRPEYKNKINEEAARADEAFKLVKQAFDVLTGGKRPGMRGT